jgi:hypothetical protein
VSEADESPSIADALDACGMSRVTLRRMRNFIAAGSPLHAARAFIAPRLVEAVEALDAFTPAPDTANAFARGPFFRPPGSHRSFYYCPDLAARDGAEGAPVLAFKGLEPLARDIHIMLRDLKRPCYSPHAIAEHFVFVEDKIPACLGLTEALREAERAEAVHAAHLRVYGELARLPLPLAVFRHDDATCAFMSTKLRAILDDAAFRKIEPILAEGLGVYVYYYPAPPLRARDADYMLQGLAFRRRLFALIRDICEPETIIARWVRLFARMLLLGFAPGSLASLRTGACCQPQNACLDGGFVDLDSITPFSAFATDASLFAALQFSTDALMQTLRTLAAGAEDPTRAETQDVRIDLHYFRQYLLQAIAQALDYEQRPNAQLDPRVARYFTPPHSFEALVQRLSGYYSADAELAPEGAEIAELTTTLLRASRRE